MKIKNITKAMLIAALLTGCSADTHSQSSSAQLQTYSNTSLETIFDTVYAYSETTYDTDSAKQRFTDSEAILQEYNQLFDIYNNYDGINNLKTINDNAGITAVEVDQRIIDMLLTARNFYEYSNGEFDITIGSLLSVWHQYRTEGIEKNEAGELGELPSEEELMKAAQYSGWEYVEIDDEANTVFITDANVSLDVGAIAKGYAAEMAANAMMEAGMSSGYLNVGRNIRLVGSKPDGSNWNIGVADPDGELYSGILIVSLDHPTSIVTSGDYERYYIASDGSSYSHIIDPSTLYPATLYRSITILTEDSGAADCLSTTLFTLTVEEGKKVLETYEANTGKTASAIWIMLPEKDQSQTGHTTENGYFVTYTDDLEGLITWNS